MHRWAAESAGGHDQVRPPRLNLHIVNVQEPGAASLSDYIVSRTAIRCLERCGCRWDVLAYFESGLLPVGIKAVTANFTKAEEFAFVPDAWRWATGQLFGGSAGLNGFGQRTPPI